MNGPLKMYRTKQFVRHDFPVELPTCMYKLKNIHASRNGVEQRTTDHTASSPKKLDILDQNNQNIPGMAALEVRQEEILKQLAELKKQMDSIRNNLNQTNNNETSTPVVIPNLGQPPALPDIVINASPSNPPYSLEIIQKLWKNYLFLSVKSFIHSSLNSLSDPARELAQNLENFTVEGNAPKVNVRLIWKDVGPNTELVLSQRPISGEINILRYLSRVSSPVLNYETYPNVLEIDALLDIAYGIVNAKTKTERVGLLQTLNKSLGKNQWLGCRNQISIADLAAYSAIKQVTNPNEVNVNLTKWLQRCAAY